MNQPTHERFFSMRQMNEGGLAKFSVHSSEQLIVREELCRVTTLAGDTCLKILGIMLLTCFERHPQNNSIMPKNYAREVALCSTDLGYI